MLLLPRRLLLLRHMRLAVGTGQLFRPWLLLLSFLLLRLWWNVGTGQLFAPWLLLQNFLLLHLR